MIRQSLAVLSAVVLLLIGAPRVSESSKTTPGRLGVKGTMGFLVTAVESVQERDVKQGDIIVSVNEPCAVFSVNDLRTRLSGIRVGEVVPVTVLRYSRKSSSLQKLVLNLRATSLPSGEFSSFGLKTRPGLVVNEIDPDTGQSEIRRQDIIVSTELNGIVVNIKELQTEVRRTKIGSSFQASILRYNSSESGFDHIGIRLRVYPFPSLTLHHSRSEASGCPSGACQWCCNVCFAGTCMESSCETGAQCVGRCIMSICA
jgi:hypothetical protein